ncbi:MAG: 1-acyl-sn-glycerol-3-phosphate acyltransferase [Bacteroidales bacterium]|nr:1-acyl-sn-glycerol-3-phosphate acyltransferase [Bacteroidales bacterium]
MRSGINAFLSFPVFAVLYCYTAVGVVVVFILTTFKAKRAVQFLTMIWAKSVFAIMGKKLTIKGKNYLDKNNRYILVANHASLFDIVAITSFYPQVAWFGHERLLKVPVFGGFLRLIGYVPFREPTIRNTRHMLDQLIDRSKNQSVAMFPEGTRTLDGKINPFFRGFIYLMRTGNSDILPITLNGFYNLKPKNRLFIDFGSKLEVIIHKPVPGEELKDKTDDEIIKRIKGIIESAYNCNH